MKKFLRPLLAAGLMLSLALPVSADGYVYTFTSSDPAAYMAANSVEPVHTADRGERKNEDVSKNAALIPPGFGTPAMDVPDTGEYLTPSLAPGGRAYGTVMGGGEIYLPTDSASPVISPAQITMSYSPIVNTTAFTDATTDLYYNDGSLGTLRIPAIGLTVSIYEGTDSAAMARGAGHFTETSIWDGNVALASHNRGSSAYFGNIHTLAAGDEITLSTKLGTRTYAVTNVSMVSETDSSALAASADNRLTLYTCVRDQRDQRWCVQAAEV